MEHETITPEEAAGILRVHPHTVYRALRAGKLPGGKIGGQWRIRRSDLEDHLRGRQVGAAGNSDQGGVSR